MQTKITMALFLSLLLDSVHAAPFNSAGETFGIYISNRSISPVGYAIEPYDAQKELFVQSPGKARRGTVEARSTIGPIPALPDARVRLIIAGRNTFMRLNGSPAIERVDVVLTDSFVASIDYKYKAK